MHALSLGHWLARAFMAEAAQQAGLEPDRLSFAGCLRVLRHRMPEYAAAKRKERKRWRQALLGEMAQERTEKRRDRIYPRAVKVKRSKFKKKRAEHRGVPPLSRPFDRTIVLLR